MKLNQFTKYVPDYLIDRGYEYFINQQVKDLREIGPLHFLAIVSGSEEYEVEVELDDDLTILYHSCDCPHDVQVCKHLVAVFYSLLDFVKKKKEILNKSDVNSLKTLLLNQDKETLVETFMQLISNNFEMQESLRFRLSEEHHYEVAEKMIKPILSHLERLGEPEEKYLKRFDQVVSLIYHKIELLVNKQKFVEALNLGILVLHSYSNLIEIFEDFDYLYDYLYEAVSVVENVVKTCMNSNHEHMKDLFDTLVKLSEKDDDFINYEIITILIPFTKNIVYRNQIERLIELTLKDDKENLIKFQVEILELNGEITKATQIMNNHINYPQMREKLINNALKSNDYHKVLDLAISGEEQANDLSKWYWQNYQLKAYKELGDLDSQKALLSKCFLNGKYELKQDLKRLYSSIEWDEHVGWLIQKIREKNPSHYMIKQLAKEEKRKDILYQECLRHTDDILSYYQHLLPEYKDQIEELLLNYYHEQEKNMNSRSNYRHIASILWIYYTIYGFDKTILLINDLKMRYPKRPALHEELNMTINKMK